MEYSFKTLIVGAVLMVLLLQQAPVLMATDADPLQDFCVADLDSEVTVVNGHPCKPASAAGDEFLFSSRIATGGDVNANPNGSNVTELDVAEWPGVNTLGVSMNREAPTRRTLDSGNRLYSKVVRAGETFVIPRGLMHFQFNVGKTEATMVVSFNSQNPGIVFVPLTLFGSNPPIPTPVLVKALRVDAGVVELLKSKFTGGY
uniref:Germin-like protein n=1 Tax=Leersia perrieri TaxID=77586 RepID=A0A0D9VXQ8_9ORYZ